MRVLVLTLLVLLMGDAPRGEGVFCTTCRRTYPKSERWLTEHRGQCVPIKPRVPPAAAPAPPAENCPPCEETGPAEDTSADYRDRMYKCAFVGLTRLRLAYNASDAQVQSVKGMFSELLTHVRDEFQRVFHNFTAADEQSVLPAVVERLPDVFQGLQSSYMEQRARHLLLPDLKPTPRVLGKRYITHELPGGREVKEEVQDIIYDYDIKRILEAMFSGDHTMCEDFLSSRSRWERSGAGPISDMWHGTAIRQSPVFLDALCAGKFPLLLHYYMDGLGIVNPLGAAAKRHKIACSYVAVINFSPSNRTSPHFIIPVSICFEKDWTLYPEVDIVCGPVDEPYHGTSFGAQMRRLKDGVDIACPSRFAHMAGVCVRVDARGAQKTCIPSGGGIVAVSADSPAGGTLMGTKIAFGPLTVAICDSCYCKQVDGDNHCAHCVPNSFLPWARDPIASPAPTAPLGAFTGLTCSDAHMTSGYDPDRQGALQLHRLRTAASRWEDLSINERLAPGASEYFMQQIGVRTFNHAFMRLPYGLHVAIVKDLMHAELLGNLKEHQSRLLWTMNRKLGWLPSGEAFNSRMLSFQHWSRGARRRSYIVGADAFAGPINDCSVGGLWTAHNEMLFVCYSIELLGFFVPAGEENHPVWRCWCMHYKYVMLCLQKEFSLDDIRELDVAIYEFQTLYLEVYGKEGWLPKFNFAQHFPLDILKYVAIHRAQTNLPHTPRRPTVCALNRCAHTQLYTS